VVSEAMLKWVELARNRSSENSDAMSHFQVSGNRTGSFGTLRQELDTLIRAMYLLRQDLPERERLVELTLNGERWRQQNKRQFITDREMVGLANELEGWSEYVYKFGCAFIHLSDLHGSDNKPLADRLSDDEKKAIRYYVQHYHSVDFSNEITLDELLEVSDRIFDKIRSNLECYLDHLVQGDVGAV